MINDLDEQSDEEPLQINRRPKRSKLTVKSPVNVGHAACESPKSSPSPTAGPSKSLHKIPNNIPPGEPGDLEGNEGLACHQCRVNTTRYMICDQSKDPNCDIRVCITCLMKIAVYHEHPELRAPVLNFVPGGTMLCVKCRNLCPCESCRRRLDGDTELPRDLASSTNGFYGLTSKERLESLSRKRRRHSEDSDESDFDPGIPNDQVCPKTIKPYVCIT